MAGPLKARKARRGREWRRRIARFEKTEQSVAEFCRQEGVSKAAFYAWRKRLADAAAGPQPAAAEAQGEFTPVRLVGSAGIAVQLPGGTRLHVPTADRRALRLVVATLARADARRAGGGRC